MTVTEKENNKKQITLRDKIHQEKDFYDFVNTFLEKYKNESYEDKLDEEYLKISESKVLNKKVWRSDGIIKSGDYGITTTLHHTETREERERSSKEAELYPFYFCIHESTDPKAAILCTQRIGNIGVKTTLQKALKDIFTKTFPNHNLEIVDHLPSFYTKQFFDANRILKIEYSYVAPIADAASCLEDNGDRDIKKSDATVKIIVKPQRGSKYQFINGIKGTIQETLSKVKPKILNIPDSNKLDTSVTLENSSGRTRTFRISQDRDILPYIDITTLCEMGTTGHPNFDAIRATTNDILFEAKLITNV